VPAPGLGFQEVNFKPNMNRSQLKWDSFQQRGLQGQTPTGKEVLGLIEEVRQPCIPGTQNWRGERFL
jgi:hypothetical protein